MILRQKTIVLFFLAALLFLMSCDSQDSGISSKNNSFILKEDFEDIEVGPYQMADPWEAIVGAAAYISNSITNEQCIQGEKCLKTKSVHLNFDPYYCAYYLARYEIDDLNKTFYSQFYFKYSYHDTLLSFDSTTSGYFNIVFHEGLGLEVVALGNKTKVVIPGVFSENAWYRVEMKIDNPDSPVLNIRVYAGNETTPINGSTMVQDIPIYKTEKTNNDIYNTTIFTKSEDLLASRGLIQNPEVDLEFYAWFVDDIRIGTVEEGTLLVGFE